MSAVALEGTEEAERLIAGNTKAAELVAERRSRRLLRAVETYKAACLARDEEPHQAEGWLALLAALSSEQRLER